MSVYDKERPEYLSSCLQSLAQQTLKAREVILVEDGPISSELTKVIEEFRDNLNIVSVYLPVNSGLAVALNEGLKRCRFDLVARMDSDDVALPDRFEKQAAFMLSHPDISASSGFIEEFTVAGQAISQRILPLEHDDLVRFAKRRSPLSHPAVMFQRDGVLSVGGYPLFRNAQDYALWSLLIVKGKKLANIPEVLVRMRAGSDLMDRRGFKYFMGEIALLKFQYEIEFLTWREFFVNFVLRAVVRLSPTFIKLWLYKASR